MTNKLERFHLHNFMALIMPDKDRLVFGFEIFILKC